MNTFLDLARKRYSSRSYQNKPVEEEKLMQILEAAQIAPSASNRQPWYFIVVRDRDNLLKISACYARDWIKAAPVIIVACADHVASWKRSFDGKDHADVDLSIAIDHMTLAATDMGLATCWICHFDAIKCRQILNIPDHVEPIALLPLAYPADNVNVNRHQSQRKPIDEIVKWERF